MPIDRRAVSFHSVDSLPHQLSRRVSRYQAAGVIVTFLIVALFHLWVFETGLLDQILPARDYVFGPYTGQQPIALRSFVISFYVAFAAHAAGTVKARLLLALDMVLSFVVICALLDFASLALLGFLGEPFSLGVLQVVAGLFGYWVFSLVILQRGIMPVPVPVEMGTQFNLRALVRLALTSTIAGLIAVRVSFDHYAVLDQFRGVSLLGGIGPGIVLFVLLTFLQLYTIAVVERRLLSRPQFVAPLTIMVPAYNEQYVIAHTIRHIDEAAACYGAAVELIVLDNASIDSTKAVAEEAIAACSALSGRIILVPTAGKAHALNEGVSHASHDFIVRIDADTQIRTDSLTLAMQNMGDPEVAAVGGVPVPPGGGLFDGSRLIETLIKHRYYSPGLSAMAGLVGIPGMFVIYRADALRRAGRFSSGMNGEDTDISLRIASLGYRTLVDHRVSYVSEVPHSFAHLREQRLRWFRSIYHVSARSQSLIFSSRFSVRGKVVLPYMLMNTARRTMMIPLVLFGVLDLLITPDSPNTLTWKAVLAVLLGSPALIAILAIILSGRLGAFLHLPPYMLFRALRSWYTLESALTIPIKTRASLIWSAPQFRVGWLASGRI